MRHKAKVLFFSTGNAERSRMAQGFLHCMMGEELDTVSTAVRSVDSDPLAVEVMREVGIDIRQEHESCVAFHLQIGSLESAGPHGHTRLA